MKKTAHIRNQQEYAYDLRQPGSETTRLRICRGGLESSDICLLASHMSSQS
jgi:hypothetical protein